MNYQNDDEYRRWRQHGHERGWFDRARDEVQSWFGDDDAESRRNADRMRSRGTDSRDYGMEGARQFQRDSRYQYSREENRPYGYMYGSQTFGHQGPIDRWTLGNTEFGEYGTRPADRMRPNHVGRGPRNYKRNDERIKEDIVERLIRNHEIDGTDLEVEVKDGEVILKGMVESRYERRLAEDITEDVFGVKNVQNSIKVRERIPLTDHPKTTAGEDTNPRTKGGIMGTSPGGNNR